MDSLLRKIIPIVGGKMNISTPSIEEWFTQMYPTYTAAIVLSLIFSIVIINLGFLHLYYVWRYVSIEVIQVDLYWLVCCSPICSICAFLGMIIPRAGAFLYAFGLVFFMLCLFVVVTLKSNLFGGRAKMCEYLMENNKKLKLKVLPFCCCCNFLPEYSPTEKNVRRMEWLIFQSPLLRAFLEIINIVVYLEISTRDHMWFTISSLTGILSMLVASYGTYIVIPLGSEKLSGCRFNYIFRYIDIIQTVYSVQKFCLEFMASLNILTDGPILPGTSKALFWTSFLIILEMFICILYMTYAMRPKKNSMLDKHNHRPRLINSLQKLNIRSSTYENNGYESQANDDSIEQASVTAPASPLRSAISTYSL
uniref:Organic solute transporter alpha-like protein n=1 Tax=Rhabditophanes sp. KR3021 TaxID=114890 RepID=A0AC35U7E0_9BILA